MGEWTNEWIQYMKNTEPIHEIYWASISKKEPSRNQYQVTDEVI